MKFLSQSNPCFLILVLLSAATLGRSTAFVVVPLPNRRTAVVGPIQNKNDGRLFVSANEEEEEGTLGGEPSTTTPTTPVKDVKCPDCDLCDGSGRIAGGIGAVAPWWPIKAYRPCPNFIERGGVYERSGQGLDEIAFGRDK